MVTPTCGHFTVQIHNPGTISYRPCKYKGMIMHSLVTVPCQRKLGEIFGKYSEKREKGSISAMLGWVGVSVIARKRLLCYGGNY